MHQVDRIGGERDRLARHRPRHTDDIVSTRLTRMERYKNERFFSSLRSGLKTWACGGLDSLNFCPFGIVVLNYCFQRTNPVERAGVR